MTRCKSDCHGLFPHSFATRSISWKNVMPAIHPSAAQSWQFFVIQRDWGAPWKAPTQVPTLIFYFKQWSAGWYLLSSETLILKKYSLKLYPLSEASLDVVPFSLSKAALLHSLWFSQWAVSSYSGDEVVFASFFCCFFLSEKRKNNGLVFASVSN